MVNFVQSLCCLLYDVKWVEVECGVGVVFCYDVVDLCGIVCVD